MEANAARVVLIGPEASGKTTLARELSAEFKAPWTPEAARLFAESWPEPLSMRLEDEALATLAAGPPASGARLIIRDTDLVSTVVYSRHYYGVVEEWIEREARARRAELYLLCRPDLPWLPDGVRDRPLQRERLFEEFRAALTAIDARHVEIVGAGEERRRQAREAVGALLAR